MTSPFRSTLLLLSLGALLSACASSPEQTAERYKERCVTRGYQPGTDAHSDCMRMLESASDVRRETNRRDMMERRPDHPLSGR